LLGFINSNLATFFIKLIAFNLTKGAFTKVRTNQLARLPVKEIVSPKDRELEYKIIQNVNRMLKLQEQLQTTKLETQLQQIQRTIDHTERKIDELVYELYGLSEEEIETIENC
jgi:septal ring factor EnvC (AmiA/AmiB activator)